MFVDELDERIRAAVRSDEEDIPAATLRAVRERLAGPKGKAFVPFIGWPQFWAVLAAAFTVALLVLLPLVQTRPLPEKKITQIRTEFSIPEKSIKIIWVQRDDFWVGGLPDE